MFILENLFRPYQLVVWLLQCFNAVKPIFVESLLCVVFMAPSICPLTSLQPYGKASAWWPVRKREETYRLSSSSQVKGGVIVTMVQTSHSAFRCS